MTTDDLAAYGRELARLAPPITAAQAEAAARLLAADEAA